MKKIFLIQVLLVLIGFSCSEDFLKRDPLDKLTDASLSYSAEECRVYVNKYYKSFGGPPNSYIYHSDLGSDNMLHVRYNHSSNYDIVDGLRTLPSSGAGWGTSEWENIRSVNFLLDNYTKSNEIENAKKYVGEATFFRAYFYFEQFLKKFGGVPWIETQLTLNSDELLAPRLKRNELADKILADLDWAIAEIPSRDKQENGRISKEVAQLYKARIALFEGTWEKYHSGTIYAGEGSPEDYFKIARDAAKSIMESGLFSLDNVGRNDGYHTLFNQHNYSNSSEVMLWKEFDRSLGLTHNYSKDVAENGDGVGVTRWLVDSYLCIDGKPITLSNLYNGDDNNLNIMQNRDPRLKQTVFMPGRPRRINYESNDTLSIFTKPDINLSDNIKCATGFQLAKGLDPDIKEHFATEGAIKASIIFRYAEALLIYAEARVELGEITQSDIDETINLLRDRVGMPHLTLDVGFSDPYGEFTTARGYDGIPISNLLQEIRRERRIELACEGFRIDDLKRWRAHHLWNNDKIQGAKTSQFEDLSWLIDYFESAGAPNGISGGVEYFLSETVAKWTPEIKEGENYWTDGEGYFAPYKKSIPDDHFTFNPNKSYLLPIPTEQLLLNKNLTQNPGWER